MEPSSSNRATCRSGRCGLILSGSGWCGLWGELLFPRRRRVQNRQSTQILELAVEVDWEGVEGGCEFSEVITKQSDDTIEDFLVDAHAGDVFTISAVTPDLPRVTRACTAGPSVEVNEALVVRVEADLIVGLMVICDDAGNWQVTGPPPSP